MAVGDGIGRPSLRFGFAGERGVIDAHADGFGESRIGGNLFAFFQHEHIARYQFAAGNLLLLSVAKDPGLGRQHAA